MRLERVESPIGQVLLVTDADGALVGVHRGAAHRVIGAGGELRGYAGGLERKRWLLSHEGASVPAHQEPLF